MTPINQQLNIGLLAMNALNSLSAQSNPFAGNNSDLSAFGSFDAGFSALNALNQGFDFSSISSAASAPLFNFNLNNFQMPSFQMPSFNLNLGALFTANTNIGVNLTADKAKNAVQLATSQIGVRENGSSNDSAEIRKYKNGSANNNAWCASFVSWCYGRGQNGNNKETFGYTASSQQIRIRAQKAGYYRKANSGYTPKVGDVFVQNHGNGRGHTGIVTKVNNDGTFETVEGNCGNAVSRMKRSVGEVDGFAAMNEWLAA